MDRSLHTFELIEYRVSLEKIDSSETWAMNIWIFKSDTLSIAIQSQLMLHGNDFSIVQKKQEVTVVAIYEIHFQSKFVNQWFFIRLFYLISKRGFSSDHQHWMTKEYVYRT